MISIKTEAKTARLEARISKQQKFLIEKAAAYEGRSVSEFVVQTAQSAAQKIIERNESIRLNAEQSRAFVGVLLKPSKPNRKLRDAFKDYHKTVHPK